MSTGYPTTLLIDANYDSNKTKIQIMHANVMNTGGLCLFALKEILPFVLNFWLLNYTAPYVDERHVIVRLFMI